LNVLEIDLPPLHDMGMDVLTMLAGLLLPGGDGPLVKAEGGDDGLKRAAVREQDQHQRNHIVCGPFAVIGRPPGRGEGAATGGAFVASVGAAMNMDAALSDEPSGGAIEVVAELVLRVHRQLAPGLVWRPSLE
jgi:hypothetical protein